MTAEARTCATCETLLVRTLDANGKAGRWPLYCPTCKETARVAAKRAWNGRRGVTHHQGIRDAIREEERAAVRQDLWEVFGRIEAVTLGLQRLVDRVEAALARPPVVPANHRRIADGGRGARRERRRGAA